jgi:hypothetical protein
MRGGLSLPIALWPWQAVASTQTSTNRSIGRQRPPSCAPTDALPQVALRCAALRYASNASCNRRTVCLRLLLARRDGPITGVVPYHATRAGTQRGRYPLGAVPDRTSRALVALLGTADECVAAVTQGGFVRVCSMYPWLACAGADDSPPGETDIKRHRG